MVLPIAETLYRLVYDGLLSRLPERRAVIVGQALLRALPEAALKRLSLDDPRLAVRLGGVRLANPIILSSMYYDPTILGKAMALGFGAVTTKSITVTPRAGHPEPNLVRLRTSEGAGFVNCNGFHNPGLDAFRVTLSGLSRSRPLIVSVAGESVAEYQRLVEGLEPYADLVEINISSPNTRLVYELSGSPDRVRHLLTAVRQATRKPVIVKLSPDYADENHGAIVPAIRDAGIEVVNFGNSRRVVEPRLSQGAGGVSGPSLFANVVENIQALRQTLGPSFGLIATGGIDSPAKAITALEAGADAVSYFTAFVTRGPTLVARTAEAILALLARRGLPTLGQLRGDPGDRERAPR